MKAHRSKPPRTAFFHFYYLLSILLTPIWHWALKRRLRKGKETPDSIAQRWVQNPPARPRGILIWGHAVGVGESLALVGLMRRIAKDRPDVHFLITTTARTSQQALAKQQLGHQFTHQFMPVDTPKTVEKFLNHWQPDMAIWCELDLWAILIEMTFQRQIPMFLVNIRIDAQSLAKKHRAQFFYRPLLQRFTAVWAQNAQSIQALESLGVDKKKLRATGTIKACIAPLAVDDQQLQLWQPISRERPIWLLASSHAPEELLALQVHQQIQQTYPKALLIIVPRIPKRSQEIEALCQQKYPVSAILQRSQDKSLPTSQSVYIADTMGELGLWYRIVQVAMIGGSWAEVGGHNPFEASTCDCLVLHGSHIKNFSESYQQLNHSGQAIFCTDATAIADHILATWGKNNRLTPQTPADFDKSVTHKAYQQLLQHIPTD